MDVVLLFLMAAPGLCAGREYHFINELKTFPEAQCYCREKYTDLATIDSMKDVKIINHKAPGGTARAWIGLYDDVNSWRWSLSDTSFYQHGEAEFRRWGGHDPDNHVKERCTSMHGDGFWKDVMCTENMLPVCSDVRGRNVTFVLINIPMTWTEAQSYCREHHTDLASVRNETENQKVHTLGQKGGRVWIGLFRDSWKWSDGSNSSFRFWKKGESSNYNGIQTCAVANFSASGRWMYLNSDQRTAFICHGPASSSKQVIRVRLSSSLDLNDPAVMERMLQQFKQKLKDQGVKGDIRLSWRKQADGKVFHKEGEL